MIKHMKILFDARYIRTDYHDGISRYGTELGNALSRITPLTFIICDQKQLDFLPNNTDYVIIHKPTSPREILSARYLNQYKPDVVYSPMQTIGGAGRNYKLIYTLHDMIYYRHRTPPTQLHPLIRAGWRIYHSNYAFQRAKLNSADAVVTVSETSKNDILNARLTKRPVAVVHNAPQKLSKLVNREVITEKAGPRNLIYMGSFMKYKNVETLVAAMKYLPEYTLHLLSRISDKRKNELQKLIPKNAKIIFHNGVSDKKYAELLVNNAALVTASRDEGYGLPIAEAMALGVPVVISDIPVFHEVAGDGATYADQNDPRDFADKIKLLEDEKYKNEIIKKGLIHVEKFSWDKSAATLFELIKKISADK